MNPEQIKEYGMTHRGLYIVNNQVVWFDVGTRHFFPQGKNDNPIGFLVRQRVTKELLCRTTEQDAYGRYVQINRPIGKILLTKEILERNGFRIERDYGQYYRAIIGNISTDNYVSVGLRADGSIYNYEVVSPERVCYGKGRIPFVHEFQSDLISCGYVLGEIFKV